MPDPLRLIPLAEIDAEALSRDRTRHDEADLAELRLSIARHGLRMPIEVFELPAPTAPTATASSPASAASPPSAPSPRPPATPALRRHPRLRPRPGHRRRRLRAMVEENAIRAGISPWEQAMVAVKAARAGAWAGIDAAIAALYGNLGRHKRNRIRAIASVADELEGHLAAPEASPSASSSASPR